MKVFLCLLLLGGVSYASAINVSQCHDIETPIEGLSDLVTVGNCKKPPCRLRRNNNIKITLKLKPDKDVDKLSNTIQAYIAGVPFPFPGYDQTDACKYVFSKDGKTQVGCPLKKGEEYLYENNIEVLQIYPRVKAVVHWGLTQPNGKDIICFEVPARITN